MITVLVDKTLCVGSGCCMADAPDAFVLDDDELAEPTERAATLPAERLARLVANCPGRAISFEAS